MHNDSATTKSKHPLIVVFLCNWQVCCVEFDRKDINMNKLVATSLEGKFHVFDLRTQHPTKGFASVSEKVINREVILAQAYGKHVKGYFSLSYSAAWNMESPHFNIFTAGTVCECVYLACHWSWEPVPKTTPGHRKESDSVPPVKSLLTYIKPRASPVLACQKSVHFKYLRCYETINGHHTKLLQLCFGEKWRFCGWELFPCKSALSAKLIKMFPPQDCDLGPKRKPLLKYKFVCSEK